MELAKPAAKADGSYRNPAPSGASMKEERMEPAGDDLPKPPLDPDVTVDFPRTRDPFHQRRRDRRVQSVIVVALACGGVFGAVSRYAISLAMPTQTGKFPWDTFLINISGAAVLGFILTLLLEQFPQARLARPIIGTGFLGAYTTFSTFMVEAVQLIRDRQPVNAVIYLAASVFAGLLAVWLGMMTARIGIRVERWLQEEMT
jgi:fluoride exporter